MREIKFRVWDGIDYMSNPFNLQHIQNKTIQFTSDLPVMQFTGIYDKNGKEIYEGDILHCHEYDSSDCGHVITQTFKNAVVGFNHGSFYYYPKGNMNQPHQLLMYAYKPEVLGNIYQNPELLDAPHNLTIR